MSNETWKPIPGLEPYYQVSNLGRVKSLARETVAKWKSIPEYKFFFKERILKPSKDKCGYLHVRIGLPKQKASLWKVHQLVWLAFHPEYDRKKCGRQFIIHHKDHNKQNNCLDNLELISSAEHRQEHTKDYWEKNPTGTRRLIYRKKPTLYALSLIENNNKKEK